MLRAAGIRSFTQRLFDVVTSYQLFSAMLSSSGTDTELQEGHCLELTKPDSLPPTTPLLLEQ